MKSAMEIATIVNENMPGIGFLSRTKRINGFNTACYMIQELASEEGELDMDKAVEAAAMLTHLNNKFHKGLFMTALNVDRLPIGHLNELAYGLAKTAQRTLP